MHLGGGSMGKELSTSEKFFGPGVYYFTLIDAITPIVLKHKYKFFSDEWFSEWTKSQQQCSVEDVNFILAWELVEKAHLAAVTALFRAKRWADAICLMYDNSNFIGWAASLRGLLETAGDTVDGLRDIPFELAEHYHLIKSCLARKEKNSLYGFAEFESKLDHFVHAQWMRTPRGVENKLKAKEAVTYVASLHNVLPGAVDLYHRLCAISHPSNASLNYFYEFASGHEV